jgi:hypothetical protein
MMKIQVFHNLEIAPDTHRVVIIVIIAVTCKTGRASVFIRGDLAGSVIVFAGSGLILVLSGSIVLVRYLMANPVQEQVEG